MNLLTDILSSRVGNAIVVGLIIAIIVLLARHYMTNSKKYDDDSANGKK